MITISGDLRQIFDGNQAIGFAFTTYRGEVVFYATTTHLVHLVKVSPHFNSRTGISAIGCTQDVFRTLASWGTPEAVQRHGLPFEGKARGNRLLIGPTQQPGWGWLLVEPDVVCQHPDEATFTNILRKVLDQPQPRPFGQGDRPRPADHYHTLVLHALERELTTQAWIWREATPRYQAA